MRKRTLAREIALRTLYQVDLRGEDDRQVAAALLDEEEAEEEIRSYARDLVDGVLARRSEIDGQIKEAAVNWDLHRMPVIDRNVLRMGVFELLWGEDVPPKVAINESIELAKKYSTVESGAFVNGILDKVRQRKPEG